MPTKFVFRKLNERSQWLLNWRAVRKFSEIPWMSKTKKMKQIPAVMHHLSPCMPEGRAILALEMLTLTAPEWIQVRPLRLSLLLPKLRNRRGLSTAWWHWLIYLPPDMANKGIECAVSATIAHEKVEGKKWNIADWSGICQTSRPFKPTISWIRKMYTLDLDIPIWEEKNTCSMKKKKKSLFFTSIPVKVV